MKYLQESYIRYLSLLLTFLAFFLIEFNTPVHSDDFFYMQWGGVEAHIKHYFGWSGRLVSDLFSTLILSIRFQIIKSAIIAFFSIGVCYLLVAIPNRIFNKKFSSLNFILISSLYWICSPNLGQTNFWVVGACNYLITTFFVALILYLFISLKNSNSYIAYISLFLVSLLSGCSNENICLALIYTLLVICLTFKLQKITFNYKLASFVLLGVIIGSCVLLLAPGNYVRLSDPAFDQWRDLSLFDKILFHLNRSIDYIYLFKYLLVFYILDICFLFFSKSYGCLNRLFWSVTFFSSSLIALAVMIGSPSVPQRSYSGIFFFLLLAFSVTSDVSQYKEIFKKIHFILQISCYIVFLLSFSFMFCSYSVTKVQESIRNDHINYVKMIEGTRAELTIPSYYFIRLLKGRDMFDQYHSRAQATWFQVKKINLKKVSYDYSVLKTGHELPFINQSSLEKVKVYYQPMDLRYGLSFKSTILIESASKIPDNLKIGFMSDRDIVLEVVTLSSPIKIMDRYYIGLTRRLPVIGSITIMD